MTAEAALAFLLGAIWLGAFVGLMVWLTRRTQGRRHGGRPLHLIPWYLGGEADIHLDPPESSGGARRSDR